MIVSLSLINSTPPPPKQKQQQQQKNSEKVAWHAQDSILN